jgi:hypothetical protein
MWYFHVVGIFPVSCHKNVFYCLTLVRVGSISPFIDSGGAAGGGAVRLKIWNLASD